MIEISPEIVTILMLIGLVVAILTGFPLALAVGSVGIFMGLLTRGLISVDLTYAQVFHKTPPSHSEEPPKSSDRRILPTSCGRRSRSGVPSTTRVV